MDTAQLRARMAALDRGVRQLERETIATTALPVFLDDSKWRRDVAELESLIRRLEND